MKKAIMSFMLGALAAVAQQPEKSMTLFDSQTGFKLDNIEHRNTDIRLTERNTLYIKLKPGAEWPGITLLPDAGKWDLSPYAYIHLRLQNVGPKSSSIGLRIDNPGADGSTNCLQVSGEAVPGQSYEFNVPIARTYGELGVKMFGMRGYPAEVGGNAGGKTINPANVTGILVFGHSLPQDVELEIERVWVDGEYVENVKNVDPAKFFPFIDKYGQYIHREWPGKIHSQEELVGRIAEEEKDLAAHPGPSDWDKWGGWAAGPTLEATGFFRVQKYQGKWWLVNPDGKLFISHGTDCVGEGGSTPVDDREYWFAELPGQDSEYKHLWGKTWHVVNGYYQGKQPRTFDFSRANLMRKYGQDSHAKFSAMAHRRLRSWGMNTIANWSDASIYLMRKTPYFACLGTGGKSLQGSTGYWGKFRDVFDPSFAESIRNSINGQIGKAVNDPWCIGFFVDNEIAWGDEISLAFGSLQSPADQAAKIEFIKDLQAKYVDIAKLNAVWGTAHESWDALLHTQEAPDVKKARTDLLEFNRKFDHMYFKTIRDTLKAVAPNQLYAGCRFAWVNNLAAEVATEYCDIVSYNLYCRDVSTFKCRSGKDVPLIIGEFHFGALDRGMFHTGLVATGSQADRAKCYREYVEGMLRNPQFVGSHWFKYADEPTTGRGLDGENYQIGFLDCCDTPYPEIIEECRKIGYQMYDYRVKH